MNLMPSWLDELTAQFDILRLHCTLKLQKGGQLPAYKGAMWHGWLGQQLQQQDPQLYHLLFQQHEDQQPKPYLINVGADYRQHWQANELITVELVLLGHATELADRLLTALQTAPQRGLGPERLPFTWQSLASVLPGRIRPGLHTTSLKDWLQPVTPSLHTELALQLQSPLRMKYRGQFIRQGVPSLALLLKQISRRLGLITLYWVNEDPQLQQQLQQLPQLGDYDNRGSCTRFEDWQRYSLRQQEPLPFGGLTGQLCYHGDVAAAIPWLQLGEQLHIGGKTTFGLGRYQLIY